MANRIKWTDDEIRHLREQKRRGVEMRQIARELGRSYNSCTNKWMSIRHVGVEDDSPSGAENPHVEPEPASGDLAEELREVKQALGLPRSEEPTVTIEPQWSNDDEQDIGEAWSIAEKANARHIQRALARSFFDVNIDTDKPIGVSCLSDQHIAPFSPVDMRQMRIDAELIRDTPGLYAICAGDGIDNHIKHRAAVLSARTQPGDQYQYYAYYLKVLAPKLLAVCSGNHDKWTDQFAGVDMVKWLADQEKLHYAPDEARLNITVGGQYYHLAFRHQYRFNSSLNQTHCVKQWQRFGEREFDIGVIGHHHEAAVEMFLYRQQECWACRPGSYQITSSYSRQFGYNASLPRCPTFILYPGQRKILGFVSVQDAATFLRSEIL